MTMPFRYRDEKQEASASEVNENAAESVPRYNQIAASSPDASVNITKQQKTV